MDKTQLLSIEITTECNLGDLHAGKCPNRSPERYRYVNTMQPLSDGMILNIVERMYGEFGFTGFVAWHYYCEPLCAAGRMFGLMKRIRETTPQARFLLWTNGTLLEEEPSAYDAFDGIVVTYYHDGNLYRMQQLVRHHPKAVLKRWALDGRLDIMGPENSRPCTRPFCEMVIDYYGNIHACCYDWKGKLRLGNVYGAPLDVLVRRWQSMRDRLAGRCMAADAPLVCRTCKMRAPIKRGGQAVTRILPDCVFAPEAAERAEAYVQDLRGRQWEAMRPQRVAVVFVSYLKVPETRLRDHFRWNGELYEEARARVYVVTDRYHPLPAYAECVLFPGSELPLLYGNRVFSLCKTKNAGINKALADGAEVVICLDVDTAIPPEAWEPLLLVGPHEAKVPMVRMVPQTLRTDRTHIDRGVTNTISMTALNWQRVQYDEGCVGYGADDGIIVTDIQKAGLMVDRTGEVYHVDHPGEQNARNQPGCGRSGCYGRAEGFNPENYEANKKIHRAKLKRRGR